MYKWILAIRYLVKRPIAYVAVVVVALCVFVVFVVMTVMNGLVGQFKERTYLFVGDCVVATDSLVGFPYYERFMDILRADPVVKAACPVVTTYGLVAMAGRQEAVGLQIIGIDPAAQSAVTGFVQTLHIHRCDPERAFSSRADPNLPGCILGIDLVLSRDSLGRYDYSWLPVTASYDISCFPLTAKGAMAKVGTGYANTKRFGFADVSNTGLAREDGGSVYLPLAQVQALCGMSGPPGRVTGIHVKFRDGIGLAEGTAHVARLWQDFKAQAAALPYAGLLDLVTVKDWKQYRRSTIAPMEKEQLAMAVLFMLVGITAVFIVFVVFYMLVSNKTKDIAMLKALGAPSGGIAGLMASFAILIGGLAAGIGLAAGWAFLARINRIETWLFDRFGFQLWDRTIFSIGQIPHQMDLSMCAVVSVAAMVICLAGGLIPGIQAARMQPAEALRSSPI